MNKSLIYLALAAGTVVFTCIGIGGYADLTGNPALGFGLALFFGLTCATFGGVAIWGWQNRKPVAAVVGILGAIVAAALNATSDTVQVENMVAKIHGKSIATSKAKDDVLAKRIEAMKAEIAEKEKALYAEVGNGGKGSVGREKEAQLDKRRKALGVLESQRIESAIAVESKSSEAHILATLDADDRRLGLWIGFFVSELFLAVLGGLAAYKPAPLNSSPHSTRDDETEILRAQLAEAMAHNQALQAKATSQIVAPIQMPVPQLSTPAPSPMKKPIGKPKLNFNTDVLKQAAMVAATTGVIVG